MSTLDSLIESIASDPLGTPVFLRVFLDDGPPPHGQTEDRRQLCAVVTNVLLIEFPAALTTATGEPDFEGLSTYEQRKKVRAALRAITESLLDRYSEKFYPAIPKIQAGLLLSFNRAQYRDDFIYLHAT